MKKSFLLIGFAMLLVCCRQKEQQETQSSEVITATDPHSFAEPEQAVVKHLDLDINVDFKTHILTGKAVWTIEHAGDVDEIVFDTRNLKIEKVTTGNDEKETMFALGDSVKYLGQPLSINIDPSVTRVSIYYSTSPDAAALQWLKPQQTAGKTHPFLFTQSESVLARSWIPCQDSPGIRFSYSANVTVPKELMALMSAENPQKRSEDGVYHFTQSHAIPSYLMALAVGDIDFKAVDNRTGVYAEPSILKKAAWEFADMGKMVSIAEKMYGPYQWGRYDLLILPPSFPFGGMENPNLTFATPTVIAGDRSLVSLVAHELAHSWSGNYVTNATWNDFWLNEGFTTYLERRIVEALYGKNEAQMQEVLGRNGLNNTIEEMGKTNPDTRLKTDFKDRDPDLGVSDIAYEKGYAFLRTIEEAVGRQRFDPFLREYFDSHAFQSVTTEDFLHFLDSNLIKKDPGLSEKIKVNDWVYKPGIPANIPPAHAQDFDKIDSLIKQWAANKNTVKLSSEIKSTNEKLYFITHLPESLTTQQMLTLDNSFDFTHGNSEVKAAWFVLAISHKYEPAYVPMADFLTEVGRRKFLVPLYKELIKTPEGKLMAKKIYKKARPNYHSVASNTIDELLK